MALVHGILMGKIHKIDQFDQIVVRIVSIFGILFRETDFSLEIHGFESIMTDFNLKVFTIMIARVPV